MSETIEFGGKKNIISLFMRSAFGIMGLICNFYAIDRLNISDANSMSVSQVIFAAVWGFSYLCS